MAAVGAREAAEKPADDRVLADQHSASEAVDRLKPHGRQRQLPPWKLWRAFIYVAPAPRENEKKCWPSQCGGGEVPTVPSLEAIPPRV